MTLKILPIIIPSITLPLPLIRSPPFSWLFLTRRRRIVFLTLLSPILLPLLCLSFPLLCLAHFFRRRKHDVTSAGILRHCEEGPREDEYQEDEREMGWMLLQRYLEDQLGLVETVVALYDCGDQQYDQEYDDDDDIIVDLVSGGGFEVNESIRPLLI